MQNKGFCKGFLRYYSHWYVCSISPSPFVTRHYTNKAKEIANGDPEKWNKTTSTLSPMRKCGWVTGR